MNCSENAEICITSITLGLTTLFLCGCACCILFGRMMECVGNSEPPTPSTVVVDNPMGVTLKPHAPQAEVEAEDEDPVAEP